MNDVLTRVDDLSGKVIVSCSLPMTTDNTDLVVAHTSSGMEELAKIVPKARVVSAFNTVASEVLFGVYEARHKRGRTSLVYCGDDSNAKPVPGASCDCNPSSPAEACDFAFMPSSKNSHGIFMR